MSTCDEDSENRIFGKVIDYDGWGMPVIKTLSGEFLYKNESIYPSEVLKGKKLDCDYVAWFNR